MRRGRLQRAGVIVARLSVHGSKSGGVSPSGAKAGRVSCESYILIRPALPLSEGGETAL